MELLILSLYILFTITLVRALLSLLRSSKPSPKLPPGPVPLPVIGSFLKLGDKPHKSLAELAKIYGPIMSLKLGQKITVVISSPALAKEILQKQDLAFSSRSIPNAAHAHGHHIYSTIWLPVSDQWRSLRKVLNSIIFSGKRLGASQNLRQQKVKELIEYAGKCCQEGVAVDIGSAVFKTSLNLVSNTLFSIDMADPTQDSVKQFRHLIWQIMVEVGKPNLADYFSILAKMDPQGIRRRLTNLFGETFVLFGRLIDERLELRRLRKSRAENDVIDILLNISEETGEINRTHIEHLCLDIFAGATDTTSSSVEWAMAELLRTPKTLEKAKAELEQTIGKGKPIEESDIPQLPYLQAIVKESMRLHPPAPLLIPRTVETDVEVYGYTVPQGAQVLVNAWAIGHDPSVWENPTSFMPERFLDLDVDVRGRDFELIPFGAGRRICPGLSLAIRVVPLMLGSLINSFDWKLEGGIKSEELDMDAKFGITVQKAQPLCVVPFLV
ncbi:geraniol 8-hydroxylase-like isoform X1 [Rhododendron vialii]|uniref:geraniol 8-hydroxylase-like isoform X1 n=1 Tax=Rhododendron vialii TaxID=182163 RepID=UPI00265FD782|nr:geraniol 8-hydroxylase-like isoform X1 [Rhododendron vialii]